MNCHIILVGSELLNGMTIDTNSIFIAEELNRYGIDITYKTIVGDTIDDIVRSLHFASAQEPDLIIVSGGLGPTVDDLTRDAVAEFLDRGLVLNEEQLNKIQRKFDHLGREMTENNNQQAYFPAGSQIIENPIGTAAAFFVEGIGVFPAVPAELKETLPSFLHSYATQHQLDDEINIHDILLWGIPEAHAEEALSDLLTNTDTVVVEFLAKDYGLTVRLVAPKSSINTMENLKIEINKRLEKYTFGTNTDRLEKLLVNKLKEKKYKLSLAESCTGGMIAEYITHVPGSSSVLYEGVVSYSNEAKMQRLGVHSETLEKFGAVSEQTVLEMLQGLKTDTGIAVSGVAGPGGGSEHKPVGTVYIGIKSLDKFEVKHFLFPGDRASIRRCATLTGLKMLLDNI